MTLKDDGFLLLEAMIAMVVIVTGILFMIQTMTFLLREEHRRKEELEMAIILYEMSCSLKEEYGGEQAILSKSENLGFSITSWNTTKLKIESEELSLEIIKDLP